MVNKDGSKIASTPTRAFDEYIREMDAVHKGLTSAQRRELIERVKGGTISFKLPSTTRTAIESYGPRHFEALPVFPNFVRKIVGYKEELEDKGIFSDGFPVVELYSAPLESRNCSIEGLMDEHGILYRWNPKAFAKCVIKSSQDYAIDSYNGGKKIVLAFRNADAQKAKQEFIVGNLPLVIWAAEYFRSKVTKSFSLRRLVDIGNVFLLRRFDYFNPDRNEFSTFFKKAVFGEFLTHLKLHSGKSSKQASQVNSREDEGDIYAIGGEGYEIEDRMESAYERAVADESIKRPRYANPLSSLIARERNELVENALGTLNDCERKVIKGVYWEGKSVEEIGQFLPMENRLEKLSAVKAKIGRIKKNALGKLARSRTKLKRIIT